MTLSSVRFRRPASGRVAGMALALAAVAAGAGCSRAPAAPAETPGSASAPAAEPVPAAERPPEALVQIGQDARSLFDAAYAADWEAADQELESMNEAASRLPAPLSKPDLFAELRSHLDGLHDAVQAHQRDAAMDAANAATRLVADLSAGFQPKVPYEVQMLGYFGRQLELGIAAGRPELLTRATTDLRSTWDRIEPEVERRGHADEVRRFTDIVVDLEAARRPADFVAPTRAELSESDHIAELFRSPEGAIPPELVPE